MPLKTLDTDAFLGLIIDPGLNHMTLNKEVERHVYLLPHIQKIAGVSTLLPRGQCAYDSNSAAAMRLA